ncbi:MAG: hypothetical protein ACE5HE_03870 [Phycisphaerae bacterium]
MVGVPPSLTALGRQSLPDNIEIAGRRYVRRLVFKNDFFAVTAMYESESDKVILKVGRQVSFLLMPLRWLGGLLASREQTLLHHLAGIDGIPRLIGRWGRTGVLREYIEGHSLSRGERVSDDFYTQLRSQIDQLHARGVAYVDLEKCDNVLVGDDGRPYLIDFQISWYLPAKWGGELWPARRLRSWLQAGDLYHIIKLQRRTRPDQLAPGVLAASYRRPWFLRLHQRLSWPFTLIRRRILARVAPGHRGGERGRTGQQETRSAASNAVV